MKTITSFLKNARFEYLTNHYAIIQIYVDYCIHYSIGSILSSSYYYY